MPPERLFALAAVTVLGAARVTPVVWMVAPLGGARLPAPIRIGFGLLLAAIAAPVLAGAPGAGALADMSVPRFMLLLWRELFIGVCLGLVGSTLFRAAEVAGRLADTLRGASLAEVLTPTADERSSPLGALYLLLATLVFLQIGGVPRLIEALATSYQTIPVGGGLGAGTARQAALVVAWASARLIASGVALAAPVLVSVWLTDLALGLVARAAPQIPVYFLGLPLKGLLAIGVVLLGLGALEAALAGEVVGMLRLFGRTLGAFSG